MAIFTGTSGNNVFAAAAGSNRYDGLGGVDTITFSFRLVDATVSYSGNQVIVDAAGFHTVLTGFETYQFTDGTVDENDGNPLVADLFYYSQYHDVWTAHVDADAHYASFGWKESRDPSAFFDTSYYLALNPSVKSAGVNPLAQFDSVGWTQGRPSSANFDVAAYLNLYPDVAAAHIDPLAHFLQYGAQEGRQPQPVTAGSSSLLAPNGFDYVFYLAHNPDVAAAGVDPLQHFQDHGWHEGRDPNAFFDTSGYLANNADVAAAGVNPYDHFVANGWKENRDPSPGFDLSKYLDDNPDVKAAGVDPLLHYLQHGIQEGRVAFAEDFQDIDGAPNEIDEGAANGAPVGIKASWGGWIGVTYSLAADDLGGGFTVDATTGVVSVLNGSLINFATPGHTYSITVLATDGEQTQTKFLTIAVNSTTAVPSFTSGSTVNVDENTPITTVVYDANANDTLSFDFAGGVDDALFSIDHGTGEVKFVASPNFEAPADDGGDGAYNIIVRAINGGQHADLDVKIIVNNVNDAAVLSAASVNLTETNSPIDISTSGSLTISDVDSDPHFVAQGGTAGNYGTFTIDAAGGWTYTASSVHDEFAPGQHYTENFDVASVDSTHTAVAIDILGTNEAPLLDLDAVSGDDYTTDQSKFATYATSFTSGDGDVLVAGAVAIADREDAIVSVKVDLHAAGLGALNSGEAIVPGTLPGGFTTDIDTSDPAHYLLTITAGAPQSASVFTDIIAHLAYTNPVADFSFNADDRLVAFTLTDDGGLDTSGQLSLPATHIDIAADVTDTGGAAFFAGGGHNDTILGLGGDDTISSGAGSDVIDGGQGDDSLSGGDDSDTIIGGLGDDSVDGGSGNDTIHYTYGDGSDSVDGGADTDEFVYVSDFQVSMNISAGGGVTVNDGIFSSTLNNVEVIDVTLCDGDDNVALHGDFAASGVTSISIDADEGANTIDASGMTSATALVLSAGSGSDSITGGLGDDRITGGGGDDQLSGGAGADSFVFSGVFGSDTIGDFTVGSDLIELHGFTAADVDITHPGADTLISVDVGASHFGTISVNGTLTINDLIFV